MEPQEEFENKLRAAVLHHEPNKINELLEQWKKTHGVYPYIGEIYDSADARKGNSLLCRAVRDNNLAVVQELLKAGNNPDLDDAYGFSPLSFVLQESHNLDILRELINAGANLNRADRGGNGVPPLFIACHDGNIAAIKMLVQAGANIHIRDKNTGKEPADFARPAIRDSVIAALNWDIRKEFRNVLEAYLLPDKNKEKEEDKVKAREGRAKEKEAFFERSSHDVIERAYDALVNLKVFVNESNSTPDQIVNKLQVFCHTYPTHPLSRLIQEKIPEAGQAPVQQANQLRS